MAQDPFGDIPLFREIQRLLSSSSGPVNLEIAEQVATALARGEGDPTPDPETAGVFADAVHRATGIVAGYTRLAPDAPPSTDVMTRTRWASETLRAWNWLLSRFAERLTAEMGRLASEEEGGAGLQQAFGGVGPLLLGMQTGTVVGHLARDVLARYDLPVPRDDDGTLFVIPSNLDEVARTYSFDRETLIGWVALREVTRALLVAQIAWLASYLRSLLTDVVDAIEIDAADVERRFTELQERGPAAMAEGIGTESVLPVAETEPHRRSLSRLHAFLAVFDGYADHVAAQVDDAILGDTTIIDEGMSRRDLSPSEGKTMLNSVLGLSVDPRLRTAGKTFCAAIVELRGMPALGKVWEAPDNLPSTEEIRDPFQWMERVLQ
jgi:putative hydrolase